MMGLLKYVSLSVTHQKESYYSTLLPFMSQGMEQQVRSYNYTIIIEI